jgi:hypothetical protein
MKVPNNHKKEQTKEEEAEIDSEAAKIRAEELKIRILMQMAVVMAFTEEKILKEVEKGAIVEEKVKMEREVEQEVSDCHHLRSPSIVEVAPERKKIKGEEALRMETKTSQVI